MISGKMIFFPCLNNFIVKQIFANLKIFFENFFTAKQIKPKRSTKFTKTYVTDITRFGVINLKSCNVIIIYRRLAYLRYTE